MSRPVISARHISKCYPIYRKPSDKFVEMLFRRSRREGEFWALKDISFEVPQSTTMGIVGQNGSGKSTLLQIVAGILRQTRGELVVSGTVAGLLELGAGFNPEFSGRDNVYMSGAILGFSRAEIDSRFDRIERFAEIGEFLDRPVKTYSSGMYLRLAFATAIHVDPEILLVDEALAVGDLMFQHRCMHRINQLRQAKVSILLVTHDLSAAVRLCGRCLLLDDGRLVLDDSPDAVVQRYRALIDERERLRSGRRPATDSDDGVLAKEDLSIEHVEGLPNVDHRFGDGRAQIVGIELSDALGRPRRETFVGEGIRVRITVRYNEDIEQPIVGFTLRDRLGIEIAATNTNYEDHNLPPARAGEICTVEFHVRYLDLAPGSFTLSPAVASGTILRHQMCDWVDNALHFELRSSTIVYGLVRLPVEAGYRVDGP